jgi:drug/metabolite transporter (DMT)-like permease
MEYGLGVAAAAFLGAAFVLQQGAAQQVPATDFMHLRLVAALLRRPRWLTGIATMIFGQMLSAWVIGHISLTVYEPLLTVNLLFALVLAWPLSRQRLTAGEVVGAFVLLGGVTALSVAQAASTTHDIVGSPRFWPYCGGAVAVITLSLAGAARRRPGTLRAICTRTAAGLVFALQDALTRRVVDGFLDPHHIIALLASWPGYCLIAVGATGLWLMQNAFNSAPLRVSLPVINATEPVCGIAFGIILFHEKVAVSPAVLALQCAGLAGLVAGVILVARAPTLMSIHAHGRATHQLEAQQKAGQSKRSGLPAPGLGSRPTNINMSYSDSFDDQARWPSGTGTHAVHAASGRTVHARDSVGRGPRWGRRVLPSTAGAGNRPKRQPRDR